MEALNSKGAPKKELQGRKRVVKDLSESSDSQHSEAEEIVEPPKKESKAEEAAYLTTEDVSEALHSLLSKVLLA
jgi:hypothetical protein